MINSKTRYGTKYDLGQNRRKLFSQKEYIEYNMVKKKKCVIPNIM
jgi:hypothetical protein